MRAIPALLGKIPIPSPAMGVALLALLIAASGVAVATIPDNGTITACRDHRSGDLRAIDTADTAQGCTARETQLSWKDGSTLLGKNEKAADSDKLDGLDSSQFAKASTYQRTSGYTAGSPNSTNTSNYANISCDTGDIALSGGYAMSGSGYQVTSSLVEENTYYLSWVSTTPDGAYLSVTCLDQAS